jgi:hypothetical protein
MAVINPTAQMNPMQAMMGPDVTRQQYELAQNQRYADILMQQALQEQPQGQMVSGHYVPPSPIQGLGQLLKAYVARKSSDMIPERQSQLAAAQNQQIQNMFGLGGGTTAPQARDMALTGGAMQGDVGPTNTNAARMTGVQSGTAPAMPIPAGMDARTAMMQYMINPQAYATALATHSAPAEIQKIAAASGFAPGSPQYQAIMQGNLAKLNYIAPNIVSEGGALVPAGSSRPTYIAPKAGVQTNISPTGQFSANAIPGYGQATGQIEQFQSFGKRLGEAGATPASRIDLPTGNTVGATQAEIMGLQGNPYAAQPSPVAEPKPPVVTAISPVVTKAGEQLNDQWIKGELEPARLAGDAAKNAMNNIRVLKSIDLTTGFGTDAQKTAASVLATFGVKDAAKFATNAQVFESKIYESLVDTLGGQKGVQTKSDFENIQKTYAQLKNTPQANQFLLDVAEAKAIQDQRKSGYYQKASSMPELRGNLSAITNEWGKIAGSMFEVPLTDRAGNTYTLAQKYGIR